MARQNLIWKNRVINGIKVKSIRISISEVPEKCKEKFLTYERGYINWQVGKYQIAKDFDSFIAIRGPRNQDCSKTPTEREDNFIKLRIYIGPRYKEEDIKMLYENISEKDKDLCPYIESALKQYNELKKLGK